MTTSQQLYAILMVYSRVHMTFTEQPGSSFPMGLAPTASSTCPSHEEINTLHRNVKHIIEDNFLPRPCSCGGAGWTRVAYLNMFDHQQTCPSNWNLNTSPVRGCGRSSTRYNTCDSVVYPVNGLNYSSVCGKIIAYHKGYSYGFPSAWMNSAIPIEAVYVSGVSITHGPPGDRQHVWTFVGADNEIDPEFNGEFNCPCSNTTATWAYVIPSFIGNDYFCDTGNRGPGYNNTVFYLNDPLWDGEGCGSTSSCCEFNSPPWFCKSLPRPTTDDLEIRLCSYDTITSVNKIITSIDIYIR